MRRFSSTPEATAEGSEPPGPWKRKRPRRRWGAGAFVLPAARASGDDDLPSIPHQDAPTLGEPALIRVTAALDIKSTIFAAAIRCRATVADDVDYLQPAQCRAALGLTAAILPALIE